jgi:hypothetical protein
MEQDKQTGEIKNNLKISVGNLRGKAFLEI